MQKSQQRQVNQITLPQGFTYQFFQTNRYAISQKGSYEALCNNGWIKLYTKLCRVYWHTQNQFSHEVHDWKFHVSVRHEDLRRAWNLIADIFVKMNCRAGMKVAYLKESSPTKGREITIYIVKIDPKFQKSQFAGEFGLDISIEHSEEFWLSMCKRIEQTLCCEGIISNGLAEGDYRLGRYISLRNQAFIKNQKGESIYPPNSEGWNPLKYELPITLQKFTKIAYDPTPSNPPTSSKGVYLFALVLTLITVGTVLIKAKMLK